MPGEYIEFLFLMPGECDPDLSAKDHIRSLNSRIQYVIR